MKPLIQSEKSMLRIADDVVWFKHLNNPALVRRLKNITPGAEITLETDGVIGRWQRMKTGRDGREVFGIRPLYQMQSVWREWFKTRKGEVIEIREIAPADDYLASISMLFSEWTSKEDEKAFRDL